MENHFEVYKIIFEICSAMAQHPGLRDLFYESKDKDNSSSSSSSAPEKRRNKKKSTNLYSLLMRHRKNARKAQQFNKAMEEKIDAHEKQSKRTATASASSSKNGKKSHSAPKKEQFSGFGAPLQKSHSAPKKAQHLSGFDTPVLSSDDDGGDSGPAKKKSKIEATTQSLEHKVAQLQKSFYMKEVDMLESVLSGVKKLKEADVPESVLSDVKKDKGNFEEIYEHAEDAIDRWEEDASDEDETARIKKMIERQQPSSSSPSEDDTETDDTHRRKKTMRDATDNDNEEEEDEDADHSSSKKGDHDNASDFSESGDDQSDSSDDQSSIYEQSKKTARLKSQTRKLQKMTVALKKKLLALEKDLPKKPSSESTSSSLDQSVPITNSSQSSGSSELEAAALRLKDALTSSADDSSDKTEVNMPTKSDDAVERELEAAIAASLIDSAGVGKTPYIQKLAEDAAQKIAHDNIVDKKRKKGKNTLKQPLTNSLGSSPASAGESLSISEDEMLKAAIAASLADEEAPVIDSDDDSEDMLKEAIKASLADDEDEWVKVPCPFCWLYRVVRIQWYTNTVRDVEGGDCCRPRLSCR